MSALCVRPAASHERRSRCGRLACPGGASCGYNDGTGDPRPSRRPLGNLRLSVTDRCNLRCSYCMPEQDYVWLPREDILHFEEIEAPRRCLHRPRRRQGAADRRRAAAAARSPGSGRQAGGASRRIRDLAMTTNGVLLAQHATALQRRRAASADRQPRHAATRPLPRAHPLRRARPRARGHRRGRAALPRTQDRHRGHPRRQRRRARAAASSSARGARRRGAVHRVHGRRRRHALVDGSRACRAPRCSRRSQRTTGAIEPLRGDDSSAPADRYRLPDGTGVRHHLVDDRAVLPRVRSQPADGRRPVVPVPLRAARAPTCAGSSRRGSTAEDRGR